MSNERRHELEQNELAILLDRFSKAIEPYMKLISIGLAVLFVGFIGWLFYRSEQSAQRSDSTFELINANASQDPDELQRVSDEYPGTAAAAWAQLYQGQLELSGGIQGLYSDRITAAEDLTNAKKTLQGAFTGSNDPLLRSRAQMGIGRAEESLGNFSEAIAAYEQVVAIGESEAMIEVAKDRITALDDPQTEQFFAWFQDQEFAPADPSLPPSLEGVQSLPDSPTFELTELPGGEAKSDSTEAAGEEGAGDSPAAEQQSATPDGATQDGAATEDDGAAEESGAADQASSEPASEEESPAADETSESDQ